MKQFHQLQHNLMAQPPMADLEEQLALLSLLQQWQNSVAERLLQTVAPPHILTASGDSTSPAETEWQTAQRPSLTICTMPSSIYRAGSIGAELAGGDLPSPSSSSSCSLPSGGASVQSFSSSQHGSGSRRRRQALQQKTLPSWAQAGFANVNNERKWASEVTSCWPHPGIDTSVYPPHPMQQQQLLPQSYTTMLPQPASLVGHNGHYTSMPVLRPAMCDPVPGCRFMHGQNGKLLPQPGNGRIAACEPDPSLTASVMQMQQGHGGRGGRGRRGGRSKNIVLE